MIGRILTILIMMKVSMWDIATLILRTRLLHIPSDMVCHIPHSVMVLQKIEMDGDNISITFSITNIGPRAGKEIAQLYVAAPQSYLDKPLKELKRIR